MLQKLSSLLILLLLFFFLISSPSRLQALPMFEEGGDARAGIDNRDADLREREDDGNTATGNIGVEQERATTLAVLENAPIGTSSEDSNSVTRNFSCSSRAALDNSHGIMNSPKVAGPRENSLISVVEHVDATRIGQTIGGYDITQVDPKKNPLGLSLAKKADSPDSVVLRTIEARGEESDLSAVPRKISFDPFLVEEEKGLVEENSVQSSAKATAFDSVARQESKQYCRQLKKIITGIEIKIHEIKPDDSERPNKVATIFAAADRKVKASLRPLLSLIEKDERKARKLIEIYTAADPEIKVRIGTILASIESENNTSEQDDTSLFAIKFLEVNFYLADVKAETDLIPTEDLERSSKVAGCYKNAYLKRKTEFQSFLSAIECGDIVQDKNTILNLGVMAIEVVELAFKSINSEKMTPFKLEDGIDNIGIMARQLPWIGVPFNELEESDEEAAFAINETHDLINNMKNTMQALSASDAEVSALLRKSQALRKHRISMIALQKETCAYRKIDFLPSIVDRAEAINQIKVKSKEASAYYKKCYDSMMAVEKAPLIADLTTVKESVVADMLSMAQAISEQSEQLTRILTLKINY